MPTELRGTFDKEGNLEDYEELPEGSEMKGQPILCVDWDGTLVEYDNWESDGNRIREFKPGAVESLKALSRKFDIWIFSTRFNPIKGRTDYVRKIKGMIREALENEGILVGGLTHEKGPAQWFIDDRAIEFKDNWREITKRLM